MQRNRKALPLHCVFHGIRFKVNKDWVSGIDTLLFLYTPFSVFYPFFARSLVFLALTSYICIIEQIHSVPL
ncbi:hypothetical protein EVD33_13200 [Bacteroidales bacterium SW292]|nr:hypothetical protein [Bacteroidales bacterium SW292]